MKKYLALALAAIMVMSFAGCSGNTENSSTPSENSSTSDVSKPESKPEDKPAEPEKAISPADIEAAIAKALGDGYLCTVDAPEDEMFATVMAGVDLSQLDSYVLKQARVSAVDPDTVAVMKCKAGYADTAVEIINENFARTLSYSRLYSFSLAKVEGARLYKFDDMLVFIIAGNYAPSDASAEDEAKLAASEYEKIDNAIKELFGTLPENLAVVTEPQEIENPYDNNNNGGLVFDDEFSDDMPVIGG